VLCFCCFTPCPSPARTQKRDVLSTCLSAEHFCVQNVHVTHSVQTHHKVSGWESPFSPVFFLCCCLCYVLRNKAMSSGSSSCHHVSVGSELNVWLLATMRVAFQDTTYPISFFKDPSVVWQKLISCLRPTGQSKISSSRPN